MRPACEYAATCSSSAMTRSGSGSRGSVRPLRNSRTMIGRNAALGMRLSEHECGPTVLTCSRQRRRFGELSARYKQREPLKRISVAAGAPRPHELVTVCVEMQAFGREQNLAAAEQQFERNGCSHTGTELARHRCGWPSSRGKINGCPVNEITALKHRGRKPDQKPEGLLLFGAPVPAKVLLERHSTRHECEQRGAHAERRSRSGGDGLAFARRENLMTSRKCEEIKSIYVKIDPLEERVYVGLT